MSVARGFGLNGKSLYSNIAKPCDINMQFTVASANGLGVTSVKSNGYVRNVFMHTSGAPTSNNGYLNPNPAAGYALVQLNNNFNYYINSVAGMIGSTQTSTKIDNSALTVGQPYVITILGNATAAQWLAIGVPAGVTPAVGVSFIALTVGAGANTSTSRVQLPVASGISGIEVVGDPNKSIANSNLALNGGAWLMLQFLAPSFAGSALGSHTHNFTVIGGQAASTTNDIANYAGPLLGKEEATNATYLGANSATNGGVVAASAGTPAGTMSLAAAAPVDGAVVSLLVKMDGSSVTVDGI